MNCLHVPSNTIFQHNPHNSRIKYVIIYQTISRFSGELICSCTACSMVCLQGLPTTLNYSLARFPLTDNKDNRKAISLLTIGRVPVRSAPPIKRRQLWHWQTMADGSSILTSCLGRIDFPAITTVLTAGVNVALFTGERGKQSLGSECGYI